MNKPKENFLYSKGLILDSLIHSVILLASLILSYNIYKEYNRSAGSILLPELKVAIKATFPWTLIIFMALFILYGIWQNKKDDYCSIRYYIVILIIQAVIINLMFFSEGIPILIVQNLAILYFAGFILLWSGMKKLIVIDTVSWAEEVLPPIIYKPLQRNMPAVRAYLRENPSRPFAVGFIILFIISALLLILGQKKAVEQLCGIAYFLLLIGIGIELYQLTKRGNINGKEED